MPKDEGLARPSPPPNEPPLFRYLTHIRLLAVAIQQEATDHRLLRQLIADQISEIDEAMLYEVERATQAIRDADAFDIEGARNERRPA